MLKLYKDLYTSFKSLSGLSVLSSSILSKILGFILSIVVVRSLSLEEYGVFSFATSIIAFVLPLNGLGLNHSLLRFGALKKTQSDKKTLLDGLISWGALASVVQIIILVILGSLIQFKIPNTGIILLLLSFQLIGIYLIDVKKVYARLLNMNQWFAVMEFIQVVVNFILSILAVVFFGLWAYVTAIAIAPLITLVLTRRIGFKWLFKKLPDFKEHIVYGINIGLGSVASNLLFYTDIILLGFILSDPDPIALYKTASIIPLRLIFIPVSFISVFYVRIARNYQDKTEIVQFIKQYLLLFFPISILLFVLFRFFDTEIIQFLFGSGYLEAVTYFKVFIWVIPASFLLRALFGNVLAGLGKSNWNAIVAWVILFLNIPMSYWAILNYGAIGAAYVTVLLIAFSGIIMACLFFYYLKTLKV